MSAVQALRSRLAFGAGLFAGSGTGLLSGLIERVTTASPARPSQSAPRRAEALFRRHVESHGAVRDALEITVCGALHADWLSSVVAFESRDVMAGDAVNSLETLPSGCFDCVYLVDTIQHIRDPRRAAAEIVRILRPGGLVFVSAIHRAQPRMSGEDAAGLTPDCLRALFAALDCLTAEFDATDCRRDARRRENAGAPADIFGGDREGWRVTYCGRKTRLR